MRRILFPAVVGAIALATVACNETDAETLMAATPAVAAQQNPMPEPADRLHMRMQHGGGPIDRLLARKDQLGLTADQVTRLEAIRDELKAKNQPLHEQVRNAFGGEFRGRPGAGRGQWTEEQRAEFAERRAQMAERRAALAPVFEQLHANNIAARDQVQQVLTEEQRQQLDAWRAEHGQDGQGRRGRRGGPGRHAR